MPAADKNVTESRWIFFFFSSDGVSTIYFTQMILTPLGMNEMADISQTAFFKAFSEMFGILIQISLKFVYKGPLWR